MSSYVPFLISKKKCVDVIFQKFQEFFNLNDSGDPSKDTCGILTVEGRTFPVDVFYTVRYLASPFSPFVRAQE